MPYFLSPIGNSQIVDANGDPLVGGTIETYLAGTSTPATTYTDDTGGTAQGVVMTLNSLGRPTNGPVWMLGGVPLKFIIKNSLGVVQSPTFDDISGVGDTSATPDQFPFIGPTPTYISATSFSFVGDQTNDAQKGRRIRSINTGGTIYSTITNSVFAASITTVTVVNDSGVLDSGLSQVNYSLLTALTPAVPAIYAKIAENTATTTTGTSTAFVAAPFPAIASNAAPAVGLLSFHVAPTGTPTLAVSGFAALPLKYRDSAGSLQTLTAVQCPINWRTPIYTDGTNWIVASVATNVGQGTKVALTSGTTADSSVFPSWVKKISGSIAAMSGNGTSLPIAQFLIGATPVATGYNGGAYVATTVPQIATQAASTGIPLAASGLAAAIFHGGFELEQADAATNTWKWSLSMWRTDGAGIIPHNGAGTVALSGVATAIRLTFANGTDAFDGAAGAFFNINYYG